MDPHSKRNVEKLKLSEEGGKNDEMPGRMIVRISDFSPGRKRLTERYTTSCT